MAETFVKQLVSGTLVCTRLYSKYVQKKRRAMRRKQKHRRRGQLSREVTHPGHEVRRLALPAVLRVEPAAVGVARRHKRARHREHGGHHRSFQRVQVLKNKHTIPKQRNAVATGLRAGGIWPKFGMPKDRGQHLAL